MSANQSPLQAAHCTECAFFKSQPGTADGVCRLSPPIVISTGETRQPHVQSTDWCGHFQRVQHAPQDSRPSALAAAISDWLQTTTARWLTAREVLEGAAGLAAKDVQRSHQMELAATMKSLGWIKNRKHVAGERVYIYVRPEAQIADQSRDEKPS